MDKYNSAFPKPENKSNLDMTPVLQIKKGLFSLRGEVSKSPCWKIALSKVSLPKSKTSR